MPNIAHKSPTDTVTEYSDAVKLDPDTILAESDRSQFRNLLHKYDDVFNPVIESYNGAYGDFKATVNMGPVRPPQTHRVTKQIWWTRTKKPAWLLNT